MTLAVFVLACLATLFALIACIASIIAARAAIEARDEADITWRRAHRAMKTLAAQRDRRLRML